MEAPPKPPVTQIPAETSAEKVVSDGNVADTDEATIDNELMDMASGELMQAIQSKDKKGILEAIRAIVLNMER